MEPVQIGGRIFAGSAPFIVGIVNATPDSFSDGGRFYDPDAAVARALRLCEEGADLIDLGGESTRPGSSEVPVDVEIGRVVPVIERLKAEKLAAPISIDTRKPAVARAAIRAGADLVNDVSGLADPEMRELVAGAGVPVILMHMRGTPANMAALAVYDDLVSEVERELGEALARAVRSGVREERIILDPGVGFAKTPQQSLQVLGQLARLRRLGRPLAVGPSRKSFIGHVTGAPVGERLPGTLAAVTACVLAGVEFVRVHDVSAARQAALVAAAIRDAAS